MSEVLRKCILKENKYHKDVPAYFHRWVDKAEIVPLSMIGGHGGGVVKATLAIVECENGDVCEVYPYEIKFTDREEIK